MADKKRVRKQTAKRRPGNLLPGQYRRRGIVSAPVRDEEGGVLRGHVNYIVQLERHEQAWKANIEWSVMIPGLSLPAMPGMAICESIRQLKIPKVTRVGHCPDLAPFGLVAIEGNYREGVVQVYVLDTGCECVPLCTDLTRKEDSQ